jgi:estrogen-related receptor beta like 1
VTCAAQGILQGLKAVGFAAPSYAPTKLLAGWGREVCALLDGLADVTLERRGLSRLPKTVFSQDG